MPASWLCFHSSTPRADPQALTNTASPGDTVAVILKGTPLIGRLLSTKGSRAVIFFCGQRRNQELPLRELTFFDPEGRFSSEDLPQPEQIQERCPSARTTGEAWLLLESDQPGGQARLDLLDFCDLLLPSIDLAGVAAVWTWLLGSQGWFRWRRDRLIQPLSAQDIRRQHRQDRAEQLAIQLEQRQQDLLLQSHPLTATQKNELDSKRWDLISDLIQSLDAESADVCDDPDLQKRVKGLDIAGDAAGVREWLVVRGLLDPDQPIGLRGSVWSRTFPEHLDQQAEQLVSSADAEHSGDSERLDLTGLATYSLDDQGTQEVDDALSLEQGDGAPWIWIHIADPARLIEHDSPLDLEARRRATSLYLADGVMPMLPLALAAGPLSLRAGHRCAAISVAVQLAEDGEVIDERIVRSWVKPRYGLTYAEGDELIELAPPGDESLSELSSLMERRMRWRRKQGALTFERSEGRFRRSDSGPALQVIDPSPARLMVSEAMLLMGAVVASFGQRHELALPYRSQPTAELPSNDELERIPEGPARDAAIRRCLSRGVQGTQPMRHFSLGLPAYVQATSPIRRYADLLVHRQIISQLSSAPTLTQERIGELIEDLDNPLRQSIQISREDQRHWQQVWFSERPDASWDAVFLRWLRPQDQLALVHVADLAMDLVGHVVSADPAPGDPLQLRVNRVNPNRGELQLQLS